MALNDAISQNLVTELGLDVLPPERQKEALLKIGEIINQRIIVKVLEELSETDKDAFDALLGDKANDQDAVLAFLKSKIPNLDGLVAKEIADFKQSGIDFIREVTKK